VEEAKKEEAQARGDMQDAYGDSRVDVAMGVGEKEEREASYAYCVFVGW
jgi:hypothetical protein